MPARLHNPLRYAYQTPREALRFSAKMRLPASVTVAERAALVEFVIDTLGLGACADTRIGSYKVTGISGGERKRTAIGIELISSPRILFLDEPTSGLDSYAAWNVVNVLTELSNRGCTVIATIHQPSSEVFSLFQNTCLIAKGRTVFNAATRGLQPFFAKLGHVCPEHYNPADFVMFIMQKLVCCVCWRNPCVYDDRLAYASSSRKPVMPAGCCSDVAGTSGTDCRCWFSLVLVLLMLVLMLMLMLC